MFIRDAKQPQRKSESESDSDSDSDSESESESDSVSDSASDSTNFQHCIYDPLSLRYLCETLRLKKDLIALPVSGGGNAQGRIQLSAVRGRLSAFGRR